MFNVDRTLAIYQQAIDQPDVSVRQDWIQRLDHGMLNLLTREEIFQVCPLVEVRFDQSGSYTRPAMGMPGHGRIVMGGDDQGRVAGADHQPLPEGQVPHPIWHRLGVLFHESAHVLFETLGQAFLPESFPLGAAQTLNTHIFALFLNNPQRRVFAESFADCFSSLLLLSTGAPEARIEVEQLIEARKRTRKQYEALWETEPDQAEKLVHLGDLALQRVLAQHHPLSPDQLVQCALSCASDGMVDHWRINPDRAMDAIERSWTQLDPVYAAGQVRRAMSGGYDLAAAWATHYPKHPLVRLWGPLTRRQDGQLRDEGATVDPNDYSLQASAAWVADWEGVYRRAMPAISHALEGYRSQVAQAVRPPALGVTHRRSLGAWR